MLGLKASADNFRTNLVTRKTFTPSCFFCKDAANHVYIDVKMSPSNLTLGRCKFELRSMPKMLKLCHVAYHSTRLDGAKEFMLLCALVYTLDQKTITANDTNARYGKCICTLLWKSITPFLTYIFWSSTLHRRKLIAYLESRGNSE